MTNKITKTRLSSKDLDLLKNISVTGGATFDFAADKVGARRVRRLIELDILKKNKPHRDDSVKNKKGRVKDLNSVSLSSKGMEIVLERNFCFEIQNFNGYRHTEFTQNVVDKLLNVQGIAIENILNEKEQKVRFKKEIWKARRQGLDIAVNDIAFYDNNNKLHSVEIETDYRNKLIKKHKNYANYVLNVKYEYFKVELPKRRR